MKEKIISNKIRKESILTLIRPRGFDIIDQCNEGSVGIVSGRNLEILDEDV
jgi:hypothetical protein